MYRKTKTKQKTGEHLERLVYPCKPLSVVRVSPDASATLNGPWKDTARFCLTGQSL
jgi:hypothetical protein